MTYKELYLKEHPDVDSDELQDVIDGFCPGDFWEGKPEADESCELSCFDCWNTEIPETCSCYDFETARCNGTKERDQCMCSGIEVNCDFYPEKRTKAAEKSDIQKAVEKIQERGFKSKDLVPAGEEIAKGIEKGILEPKTSVNFDGAEFQKKVYEAFGIPNNLINIGDQEELKNIEDDEKVKSLKHIFNENKETFEAVEKQYTIDYDNIPQEVVDELCDVGLIHPVSPKEIADAMIAEKSHAMKRSDIQKIVDDLENAITEVGDVAEKAEKALSETASSIKDSGTRREFSTGAVRDIQEGKGRCDLMPLDVVAEYLNTEVSMLDEVLMHIYSFQKHGDTRLLFTAIYQFGNKCKWDDYTMLLEVAKHFEEGAKKYSEDNWKKGIPVRCYIDSAVRHYLKFLRGDKDEPHNRAFVWNILCCIWTCKHRPELNDYRKEE